MAEQGVVLDIDTKLLDRLAKAEESLSELVMQTEELTDSFSDLTEGALTRFALMIDGIVGKVDKLSKAKIGDMGLKDTQNTATAAVDDLNQVVTAVDKIMFNGKAYTNSSLVKMNEQIDDVVAKLGEKQKLLNFYTKGEGKAAIGFVDTEELQSEARALTIELEKLTRQRESLIAQSRLKLKLGEMQAKRDAEWDKMEEIRSQEKQARLDAEEAAEQERRRTQSAELGKEYEKEQEFNKKQRAEEEKHQKEMLKWREKSITKEPDREHVYKEEISATKDLAKQIDKVNEQWAKNIDARKKYNEQQLSAAEKDINRRDAAEQAAHNQKIANIRTEYSALLAERERLAVALKEINALEAKYGDPTSEDAPQEYKDRAAVIAAILNREKIVREEIEAMEVEHQAHIQDIQLKNLEQRAINSIEETKDSIADRHKLEAEAEHKTRTTFQGAIDFSQNAKSIAEMKKAIKYLIEMRDSLDKAALGEDEFERQIKEANKELERQNSEISRLSGKTKELQDKQNDLTAVAGKLQGALATVFSIRAIKGYVDQIMRVRGEFEIQNRSLQALLKNKAEANELWDKTVKLAVKSPFQVKELVTYTKQLAAYRVESDKLYDTTKMLADISAGLGVDMQRLILAYGQVKAANYLRGTELRQFSEAGINILDDLAKYYSAVEGTAVGVAEVFERVSKRMVTFKDVERVLKNATSAGGMFYQMQEIQAETLKGKMRNLKDQMDLMLNDIGETNEAVLKDSVSVFSWAIKNYRALIPVLSTVALGFMGLSASILKAKIGTEAIAAGWSSFKGALLSPWTALTAVIIGAIAAIWRWDSEMREVQRQHALTSRSLDEITVSMNDAFRSDAVDETRIALSKLLEVAKNDFRIDFGLDSKDIENMDMASLRAKFEELRTTLFDANAVAESVRKGLASAKIWDSTLIRVLKAFSGDQSLLMGESMATDLRQYESAASEVKNKLQVESIKIAKELELSSTHMLRLNQANLETEKQYVERLIRAYKQLDRNELKLRGIDVESIDRLISDYEQRLIDAQEEVDIFMLNHVAEINSLQDEAAKKAAINAIANQEKYSELVRELIYDYFGLEMEREMPSAIGKTIDSLEQQNGAIKKSDTRWQDLMRTIREANSAYKDLNKTFDSTTAKEGALVKYGDALNDVLSKVTLNGKKLDAHSFIDMFDITTEEGMLAALDQIAKDAPEAADKLKAKLAKGEIEWEGKIKIKDGTDEELTNLVENLFSGYELSVNLEKLNIPSDFAKDYFDIEAMSLDELRKKIEGMKPQFTGEEQEKEYEKYLKRIAKLEREQQQERLKSYLQYARDAVGDRAKIKLEEMKKLQEIELAFGPEDSEVRQKAIKGVRDEAYQKEQKQKWDDFQKSDIFVNLFDDLDNASSTLINHAIDKLEEFKKEWRDMPHEEMKSIVQKINELKSKLYEYEAPRKVRKQLQEERAQDERTDKEIQEDNIYQFEKIEAAKEEISLLEAAIELIEERNMGELADLALMNNRADLFADETGELKKKLKAQQGIVEESQNIVDNNNKTLNLSKKTREEYAREAEYLQDANEMANDLYDAFSDLADVLGGSDSIGAMFADAGMSMANTVLQTLALQAQLKTATDAAHTFGAAMNTAMGVIGWIVMSVQLLTAVLKAAFEAKDKAIEHQIENLQSNVEALSKELEKVEGLLDKVFDANNLAAYTNTAKTNIEGQIRAYERMIELEEDKKKTDNDKIKGWQDDIEDLRERKKELYEETFTTSSSGILDDALSAAESFVDAWYEAFKETGDGLSGLEENFQEMLASLIKRQAALQIVGSYMDMYKDMLKAYIDPDKGDAILTAKEAAEWAAKIRETFPELSANLESFYNSMEGTLAEYGDLSDLSKGIQGVTETTAQALEALLNSMRFYVADSNTRLRNIENYFGANTEIDSPMVNELRQHTAILRSIEGMFDSVIGRGNSAHGGAYLKVLM